MKVFRWLWLGIHNIAGYEVAMLLFGAIAILSCGDIINDYFYVPIIIICDLITLIMHGLIIDTQPPNCGAFIAPWHTFAPALIRLGAAIASMAVVLAKRPNVAIGSTIIYVVAIPAICHAFRCLLLGINCKDGSWLEGLETGTIGIPNWISIIRIALALIAPHLYVRQPYGEALSCQIATVIIVCAMATDAVDGRIARKLNQCTKAGKALDPLGDKFIFYPVAIAFLIVTKGNGYLDSPLSTIFYVCFGMMVLRDIAFIVWFALQYSKLPSGIGASLVDKLRMIAMCIWLAAAALSMSFAQIRDIMAIIGFVSIAIVAVLSVASIFIDLERVKKLQRQN